MDFLNFFRRFLRNHKAQIGAIGVIGIVSAIVAVAVGSVIGLTMTAKSKDVFDGMGLATEANDAMDDTVDTIYTSWPLFGLVVLALIGAACLIAIALVRR